MEELEKMYKNLVRGVSSRRKVVFGELYHLKFSANACTVKNSRVLNVS